MSEQLPAPDFDAQKYARPNQNWICGHACEGNACQQGPDARGRCRATAECKPILKTNPGETKGRWVCTRPGGECEAGPLPDGSCCRPITKCSPVPTLRVWRGRITLAVIAGSCAVLLVLLGKSAWRNHFINPGEISRAHSGATFAALAAGIKKNGMGILPTRTETHGQDACATMANCGACHIAGNSGPHGIVKAALHAQPGIVDLKVLAASTTAEMTAMDGSCVTCHATKTFHQANAPMISCSFCHAEHQGAVIAATTDANCTFCHGNAQKMAAFSAISSLQGDDGGKSIPVINHFAGDHPQFRFISENLHDPDTLKFNHMLHLTGSTIPKLPGGEKLDCAFCHRPDATGALMKPVAFERNCRVCHSLQFDPETPQLTLPHGSADFVTAFLRSLPKQYLNLAAKEHQANPDGFAEKKLTGLRAQFGSGEELEQRVFFSTATAGPATQIGTLSGETRALFPGCALCHEVNSSNTGIPKVAHPVIRERWLAQAKFNHAKHAGLACTECHDAIHSRETADILLPARETCATCHSPRGGVVDTCATCHTFHNAAVVAR